MQILAKANCGFSFILRLNRFKVVSHRLARDSRRSQFRDRKQLVKGASGKGPARQPEGYGTRFLRIWFRFVYSQPPARSTYSFPFLIKTKRRNEFVQMRRGTFVKQSMKQKTFQRESSKLLPHATPRNYTGERGYVSCLQTKYNKASASVQSIRFVHYLP